MRPLLVACALAWGSAGCGPAVPPELQPDAVLRDSLGLTSDHEVHRVLLTGGPVEVIEPAALSVRPGVLIAFTTGDWRVHDVRFEVDSLSPEARAFLEGSGQVASPPLVNRDQRFVVTFEGAPPGRYPFLVEGNGAPARGVVVVQPNP